MSSFALPTARFRFVGILLILLTGCSTLDNMLEREQNDLLTIYFPRIDRSDPTPPESIISQPSVKNESPELIAESPSEPPPADATDMDQEYPESTIKSYWDKVNQGKFKLAWDYLSPGFQSKRHDNDYGDYLSGYEDMKLCSVKVKEINPVHVADISAVFSATVRYQAGSNCTIVKHQFDHYLVLNQENNVWLIDDVVTRPKEISDGDIATIRTIQERAARNEIDDEEAESEMLEAAADIGIEGFTWIVRNVPIYDPESESWMSFDNYARSLTGEPDAHIDPDSRFAKDPVGLTVDLFFRSPDPETMMDWFGFDFDE